MIIIMIITGTVQTLRVAEVAREALGADAQQLHAGVHERVLMRIITMIMIIIIIIVLVVVVVIIIIMIMIKEIIMCTDNSNSKLVMQASMNTSSLI